MGQRVRVRVRVCVRVRVHVRMRVRVHVPCLLNSSRYTARVDLIVYSCLHTHMRQAKTYGL